MKLGLTARQAVIGGLLILGLMAMVGVWSAQTPVETVERFSRWEATLRRLDDAETDFRDIKNWLQVYFDTETPHALEEFRACFTFSGSRLNELRQIIGDEPQLLPSLEKLSSATVQLNKWLEQEIVVHQQMKALGREGLNALQLMKDVPNRQVVEALTEFKSLVSDHQRKDARALQARSWGGIGVILGGCVAAACAALFAAWSVRRELALRRQTESQLREHQARLQAILNSEPECVKLLAPDGTLLEMNAAGLAMIEADREEQVVGQCVYPLVAAEHRPDFQKLTERVFQGESGSLEFEITGLKGTRRWLETHATPLRSPDGQIASLLSITRDITERRQAEDRLRASEKRFATVFHSSPIGICITTMEDGKFLDANKAFLKTENLALEDILGRNSLEMGYWPDPDDRRKMIHHLNERGSLINWEVSLRLKDGSTNHSLRSLERITLDGQDCILTMLSDVTDRKQAEESLRQQERRFRALIENNSDAVALIDGEGTVVYLSPSARRVMGYRQDEMIGRSFAEFVHPDDMSSANEFFSDLLARPQETDSIQTRYRHKDGSWRWIDSVCTNLLAEPSVQAIVANYRDITERKRAEAALRDSERRHREQLEGLPVAVYTTDVAGTLTFANEAAIKFWGRRPKLGKEKWCGSLRLYTSEGTFLPHEKCSMAVALREGRGISGVEAQADRPDGTRVNFVANITPLYDSDGAMAGAMNVLVDITERRQAEDDLRKSQASLEAAQEIARIGSWEFDPQRQIGKWSKETFRLFHHNPEFGTPTLDEFLDFVHPDDRHVILDANNLAAQSGETVGLEFRSNPADGPVRYFQDRVRAIRNAEGQVIQLAGIMREITEQKLAEQRVAEALQFKQMILEASPIGIVTYRNTGEVVSANESSARIVGGTVEQIKAQNFRHLESWRRSGMLAAAEAALDTGIEQSLNTHLVSTFGKGLALSCRFARFQYEGHPHLLLLVADITEHQQAAEILKRTAERLSALLATAQTLGSTLNLDTLLDQLLHRLREVISIADLSAIYIHDSRSQTLVPRASVTYHSESFRKIRLEVGESVSGKVFQTGQSVLLRTPAEVQSLRGSLRPENERFITEARAGLQIRSTLCVPLRTQAGEVIGTISLGSTSGTFTTEDLSLLEAVAVQAAIAIQNANLFEEVRVGREQLQSLSRRLIAAQETERHHLARELHDEVGQVLTAINLKLHSLKSWCGTDARTEIDTGISLIDHTIEQVRGISLNLRPAMLDVLGLEAAIRWCVEQHRAQTGWDARIVGRLESRLPPDLEITCYRVVQAALTNVARHARASRVSVEIHQDDHELEVAVQDNGVGFQIDQVQQRLRQGDGFGVLSMQERVELCGGTFRIDSTPGGGTTIRARFPLAGRAVKEDGA